MLHELGYHVFEKPFDLTWIVRMARTPLRPSLELRTLLLPATHVEVGTGDETHAWVEEHGLPLERFRLF